MMMIKLNKHQRREPRVPEMRGLMRRRKRLSVYKCIYFVEFLLLFQAME
jgi:hypothetical protein